MDNFDVTGDNQIGAASTVIVGNISSTIDSVSGQQRHVEGIFDKAFSLVEQHCFLSMPEPYGQEGFTDPYIVTFIRETGEVLSIKRNWKEEDVNRKKRIWYSHYLYVPAFGFYGAGLFHLLGNFQVTLTSVIRSLVDAGQFANLQGGLKLKGLRILGDNAAISPGEWREVESAVQDISKALFPIPYKEPSQVLLAMLQWLDGRAGAFADSTEKIIADSTNYGPVGTTMALLEASMKLFSAIHKRVHYSQEQDLKLLAEVNYEYMPPEYPYDVPGAERNVFKEDFDPRIVNIIPVSDPNITSNAHRLAIAQAKLQAALQSPAIHDMKKVYREFYLAVGVDDIDALVAPDPQAQPLSPLEDIMMLTAGKPIKAFTGQDHKSHVEFKMTWLQDPLVGGGAQTMSQFAPLVMANIREHQILQLQEQIGGIIAQQQQPGQLDPKIVAQIQAEAAAQVLKANQALAQTLGGNQPLELIAQAEMLKAETERNRVEHVKVKDLADLSIKAQKVDIDRVEAMLKAKGMGEEAKIAQFRAGLDAVKLGLDNLMQEANLNQNTSKQKGSELQSLQKQQQQQRAITMNNNNNNNNKRKK